MARILVVCNTDFFLTRCLLHFVNALAAEHEVECVCEGDEEDLSALSPSVKIHPVAFPRTPSPLGFAKCIRDLQRVIREGHYDCVLSQNRNASLAGRLASWLERVPVSMYTANGFYFHDHQGRLAREASIRVEAVLAKITDHTLSQSQEDVELMVGRGYIARNNITTIGNGVDVNRFRPQSDRLQVETALGLRQHRFRVGAVGRVVEAKGFSDLLRAFGRFHQKHPESELVIVGGNVSQDISPYAREFRAEVTKLGLDQGVILTGITDRVPEYLRCFDLFVLPSYREGMSGALLEAMSTGLPVIATRIRGCREAIEDGRSGLFFEPRDVDALTTHLEKLFASSSLRESLGTNARNRVLAKFSQSAYTKLQVDAINRMLAQRTGQGPRRSFLANRKQPRSSAHV